MQCPKCGHENPDDSRVCASCSFVWTEPDQAKPAPNKGNWVLPVVGVLLMGLAAGLTVFIRPTWAFIVALLAFLSAVSDIKRNWNKRKFRGKAVAGGIFVLSCLFMLALSYSRMDAPPIPGDYTISDLRSAPPECNQTYELLGQLTDVDLNIHKVSPIGLSAHEIRRLEEINALCEHKDLGTIARHLQDNANDIMTMWRSAEKGRGILSRLNEFPEIADLSKPSLKIDRLWYVNLRHLAFLHRAYICLQSIQGDHKTAVDTLLEYESFVRKISLNARSVIINLVCIASSAVIINTADFIINNPDTPRDSLLLLARRIIPLSREHTSLRNALICEYLTWKREFLKMSDDIRVQYKYRAISPFKLNSSLRLSRNFLDELIAIEEGRNHTKQFKVWPSLYPNVPVEVGRDGRLPEYYRIYNPSGAKMIGVFAPAINKVLLIRRKLQIYSDLSQILLDKRLGQEVSLKARAYSDEYIVDVENKKILSPGPDGKADTRDDIELPINPEVLGW